MTNPVDLINQEIASIKEQLEIDVKKVSLLQQEIKAIQEEAQKAINEKQNVLMSEWMNQNEWMNEWMNE